MRKCVIFVLISQMKALRHTEVTNAMCPKPREIGREYEEIRPRAIYTHVEVARKTDYNFRKTPENLFRPPGALL